MELWVVLICPLKLCSWASFWIFVCLSILDEHTTELEIFTEGRLMYQTLKLILLTRNMQFDVINNLNIPWIFSLAEMAKPIQSSFLTWFWLEHNSYILNSVEARTREGIPKNMIFSLFCHSTKKKKMPLMQKNRQTSKRKAESWLKFVFYAK